MLTLLILLALPRLTSTEQVLCSTPPLPIAKPTLASAVYFLFVVDNSWPEYKIAQQKTLYQMIACEIPRSPEYRVGTIYAYDPKRPADFVLDEKFLSSADNFVSTLNDTIERSYSSRAELPYDRSRCSRMHAVVEAMRLADFSYDSTVHTHYIFPTDDSEDDFVNDCDPAWTFKMSARNILKQATPNHLYFDIIRVGPAKKWTQYGERVQFADWSDNSINQRDVSHLTAGFLDEALRGNASNEVIVLATYGLERSERPKGLMTFVTTPTPPASSTSTSTMTTSEFALMTQTSSTLIANETTADAAAALPQKRGRRLPAVHDQEGEHADETPDLLRDKEPKDRKDRSRRNTTEGRSNEASTKQQGDVKHVVFGFQTPFTKTEFYLIAVGSTIGVVVLVWILCGLVFYCCYRDDGSLQKHNKKEAEEEDEMMLISGLNDHDWERPSSMMISDHLRKVKEDRYNEEQLRTSESRGTITVEA